jgi:hypothetical protein
MAHGMTLFARALPSEIKVEETYRYEALVRSLPQVVAAAERPAEGVIEARVPYDGQRFFDGKALADVRAAVRVRSALDDEPREAVGAQIGHVVVVEYGRSRLAESEMVAPHGAAALVLPVSGDGLRGMNDLRRGLLEGRARVPYEPERPSPVPVHVEVTISDEDGLHELQMAVQRAERAGELKEVERLRHLLAQQMGRKAEFSPSLRLSFAVELELSAPIGLVDDPAPPRLKALWLAWPALASYRRVLLFVEDREGQMQPYPLAYDPVQGRLQWGGLRFFPPATADNGLYAYRAPRMELHVREPGELLDVTALAGQMTVEIEALMSGLELRYFDAVGAPQPVAVKAKSVLETALTLDIVDCFDRRRFSPYQYVQFPGMVLNRMRLGDIVALLESMQFTVVGEPVEIVDEDAAQYGDASRDFLVTATRAEGASHLWLWLRVGGQTLHTERQREVAEGDSHKTLRGSGDLTIAMRGELDGSSQEPVEVLNELHKRLKRRFHFERVVK